MLKKEILTVAASAALFCILGGLIGFVLGQFVPGYYRSVFVNGDAPTFHPVQVGLGLGVSQGFAGGMIAGVIIVIAQGYTAQVKRLVRRFRWLLLGFGIISATVFGLFVVAVRQTVQSHEQWMYRDYIESEYLPAQKKKTGQWPRDLRGFPAFVRQRQQTEDAEFWLDEVLKIHRRQFVSMEIVRESQKTLAFNLHLKNRTMECEAELE